MTRAERNAVFRNRQGLVLGCGLAIVSAWGATVSTPAHADLSGFFDRIGRNTNALLESIASKEDSAFIERAVERTLALRQPLGRTAKWENPHTGHRGTITIVAHYEKGTGDPCWDYQRTLRDDKEISTYSGTACRELDSSSRSVEDALRFRLETWITSTQTIVASPPAPVVPETLPATTVQRTQELLVKAGFNPGPVDGVMGRRTRSAIEKYQSARALAVDGRPSTVLMARLESEVANRPATAAPSLPKPMSIAVEHQPLVLAIDSGDHRPLAAENASGSDDDTVSRGDRSLRSAIGADWNLTARKNIYEVARSGAAEEAPAAVRRVKGMIEAVAQLAKLRKRPFVVVAHGPGAVFAYRAIKELGETRRLRAGDIHVLVTLGAPGDLQREAVAPVKSIVGHWRNYWIAQDDLSKPLDGLNKDENVRADFDPERDGGDVQSAYYTSPRIWRRVRNDVARLATSS